MPADARACFAGALLKRLSSSYQAAVRDDPLFYVRSHLEERGVGGIYRVDLGPEFLFATCYVEDELIEGTSASKKSHRDFEETMALLSGEPKPRRPYKKSGVR